MEGQPDIENKERDFAPYAKILQRSLEGALSVSSDKVGELSLDESKALLITELRTIFLDGARSLEGESRIAFESFLIHLSSEQFNMSDQQELIKVIVDRTVRYLSKEFNVKEFESLLQEEFIIEAAFPDRLNRILAYEISRNEIELHVLPTITNNPLELRSLFVDGFKHLAQKIRTSDGFDKVEKITGGSWIVKEHPRFVESLGFTVFLVNDMSDYALAEMSKEKFLELYG